MIADLRLAPELERSQFGERDREPHRYLYLPGLASVAQDGDERRVLAHVVSPHQRHDVAGAIGSDDAAVEREGDGAIGNDGEWMIELCGGAFVRSATEDADGTTSKYRLRLVGYTDLLGAQSAVEWQGRRYAIDGDPRIYNGSRRTAHVDYALVRR